MHGTATAKSLPKLKYETPERVHGIPVRADISTHRMADSKGFWPFKRIVVGASWFYLDRGEKRAVLLHEAGHCHHFHAEKRLMYFLACAFFPSFWMRLLRTSADFKSPESVGQWVSNLVPPVIQARCREHEFEADAFAREHGHGPELTRVLSKFVENPYVFYPTSKERSERLRRPSCDI